MHPCPTLCICCFFLLPADENVPATEAQSTIKALTGGVSAGKALPALHDDIWVTAAAQLQVHLTIWETAVEKVWPWPEAGTHADRFELLFSVTQDFIMICCEPCLPANDKFYDVGENSVQHQSQSHSWMTEGNNR